MTIVAAAALAAAATFASGAVASAAPLHRPVFPPGTPETIAEGLLTPLSLAVSKQGTVYVSQTFAGTLNRVDDDGTVTEVASSAVAGNQVAAVSTKGKTVFYTETAPDHSSAVLKALPKHGDPYTVADLYAHESETNPDQVNTYGFVGLPEDCAAQIDPTVPPFLPASYAGVVDTNPHGSLALDDGVYIADAGANAILRADYDGTVETVAVLPAGDPVVATAEVIAMFGYPECAIGYEYRFEPVPTDVELGPDGWLYVTSLPGGPESPALGARGAVYKVNPDTGETIRVATGLVGATNLAISKKSGTIWVTELFGGAEGTGQVSVIRPNESTPEPYLALSSPAAIELHKGSLYVTTDAFVPDDTGAPQPIGKVTVVPLTGSGHAEDSAHR
ncbi:MULTISPECIES: ScyD/ScyE family protein [unclassified Diaminobutyricimonas]|uniref:ScyD/ScyE family protein n=1 Tax=unclassified Diaminobutyricimonas TaxID=2643261 RepID=UPI001E40C819|nr:MULTISPECIES: ScyD/ScyE family protein [unclassified Diaminobutyricimonas]